MILSAFLIQYSRMENSVFVKIISVSPHFAVKFFTSSESGQKVKVFPERGFFCISTRFSTAEMRAISSRGENGFAT